jgi:hypothetical protein
MDEFKPLNDWEYGRMMDILNKNASKTFVQRILTPDRFPTLDNGNGGIATHRMAWSELDGGRAAAFPTVLYDGKGLVDYGNKAWEQAVKSGNVIEFDSPDEASWFAQNYKGAWGGQKNKPPR